MLVANNWKKIYNIAMDKNKSVESRETIRINKYLSSAGVCSRREADRMIAEGRVSVDGRTVLTGEQVDPSAETGGEDNREGAASFL